MKTIKLYSDIIATWVAILGAGVSGTFALVQYYNNSSAERAKVALAYVERFNASPLRDVRSRLDKFWDGRAEALFARAKGGDGELSKLLLDITRESGLTSDIDLAVEFFEDLHACTCAKLCDGILARRFLGKYSLNLYVLVFPYLVDQRLRLKDDSLGRGIQSFAKAQRTGAGISCGISNPS